MSLVWRIVGCFSDRQMDEINHAEFVILATGLGGMADGFKDEGRKAWRITARHPSATFPPA